MITRLKSLGEVQDSLPEDSGFTSAEKEQYFETKALLDQQIMILLSIQFEENEEEINELKIRFVSLTQKIEEHIPGLPDLDANALPQLKRELDYYGKGKRDSFALRLRQVSLQIGIEENLIQNRFISSELGKSVDSLFSTITEEVNRQREQFDQQMILLTIGMFFIPGATLLVAIAINLYIRRSIISRILALEHFPTCKTRKSISYVQMANRRVGASLESGFVPFDRAEVGGGRVLSMHRLPVTETQVCGSLVNVRTAKEGIPLRHLFVVLNCAKQFFRRIAAATDLPFRVTQTSIPTAVISNR